MATRRQSENDDLQKNYEILKSKNERLGKVLDSLKRENERLEKEVYFAAGFCVAVVVVLILLAAGILCFSFRIEKEDLQKNYVLDSLKRENERLEKGILSGEKERLGKEKEDLKRENKRLGKEASSKVGFCVAVVVGILVVVTLCFACYTARLKRDIKRLTREKEDLQKNYDSLKGKNERLGKEKDDLQKNYETLKQEKEKVEADFKELRRNTNTCVYAVDRDWKKIIEACVNVTLDPDTASPCLTVSEDGSRVRFTGEGSAEWPSVLGREGFTSGGHYWEVEVGEKGYWVLGVSTHPHEKSIPQKPGEGYWLMRLVKGKTCKAVSQSVDQTLNLEKMCKMWGVYLDHGGGRLSFYNAETRFHIHTLEGSFPGQVYPIFSPGSHDKGPLIINTKVKNV
ncbi:erythroid membrane-associated protein-like isoform X1 [Acipenser ruthenus]|uniref:erythroid membrane-associated protein-like isoform X1 n=1 Tax=Acipenser ruthenus TaxID=7906 RepID=UPI0027404636|nr:erythroid membrane-associated protein-like isoform X1 [Acipenser ruthenus]XP_058868302.1 erythroid membrane-associated protein-like isoform X1 [Acipenser ruthenus]